MQRDIPCERLLHVYRNGGAEFGVSVSYKPQLLRQLGINATALARSLSQARSVAALGRELRGATERPVTLRDQPDENSGFWHLTLSAEKLEANFGWLVNFQATSAEISNFMEFRRNSVCAPVLFKMAQSRKNDSSACMSPG